jgi:hypothetical protein
MARELVIPLIDQIVGFGKIMAEFMSDIEDARQSQKAQMVPNSWSQERCTEDE